MNQQLGPYELIERLGVGGMAEVFLAHARRDGDFVQPCVLKILHPKLAKDQKFTRMLIEEAQLVARLRHNNIASLMDVGHNDGKFYLVMEYVQGRDLHHILAKSVRRKQSLPIAFALYVAEQLCAGLHFAHTRRGPDGEPLHLVHRDISPPNILISTVGEVKLIDFGVAKFDSKLREKTRSGVIKGKFGYMSPEQAWDEALDARSDLFAVGICLYEMLTGRSLYGQSEDAVKMLKRAREADIDPIQKWRKDLPDKVAQIIHRALARRRDDRYQSAHHFQRELRAALAKMAPDYTGLDAARVLDDLIGTDDPALASRSPRVSEATSKSGGEGRDKRGLEDATAPMQDVPDEIRTSGPFERPTADDLKAAGPASDDEVADEATVNLTFPEDADFSDEATELFDEQRISGANPTVDRTELAAQNQGGRSRNQGTRKIAADENATAPQQATPDRPPLDDAPTDPHQKSRLPRANDRKNLHSKDHAEDHEKDADALTLDMESLAERSAKTDLKAEPHLEAEPDLEPRSPIRQTAGMPVIDDTPQRSAPAAPTSPAVVDADAQNSPLARIDRRLQILGALLFVVFALVLVAMRFL